MSIDVSAAQKAAVAAEQAAVAAQAAQDGAEIEFLGSVTHVKQIREGRTEHAANRLKSRYIGVFGLQKWTALCANSR